MHPIQNISIRDDSSRNEILELVTQTWPLVHCYFKPEQLREAQLQSATLILTLNDRDLITKLQEVEKTDFPPPILILGTEADLVESPFPQEAGRVIDILATPVDKTTFSNRVNFLCRICFQLRKQNSQLKSYYKQLEHLFSRDPLTGFYNRHQLTTCLGEQLLTAQSNNQQLSLLLFNIDHFSDINIAYGLSFGDFIINEIAARITKLLAPKENSYRFAGDDFAVLLPDCGLSEAENRAEEIRHSCTEISFDNGEHKTSITISMGIASLQDHHPEDHEKFIFMAESALFTAKVEGRNRINSYISFDARTGKHSSNPLRFLRQKLSRILDKTRSSALESLQLLARNTAGEEHKSHDRKVSLFAGLLAEQIGLGIKQQQIFQNCITLHTSFRFLLHGAIYKKPETLTTDEWRTLEDLPFKMEELTDMFDYFRLEREMLLAMTENYDGSGYPKGARGNEIPLGARLIKIADAMAAMTGARAYRKNLSPREVIQQLYNGAGKQFDPALVLLTLSIIKEKRLFAVDPSYLDTVKENLTSKLEELQI